MEKWFVELHGDLRELECWRQQFPAHGDPYISDFTVPSGDAGTKQVCGIYYSEFGRMDETSALHATATKLFAEMKGWVITAGGWTNDNQESRIGAVFRLGEDGRYSGHYLVEVNAIVLQISGHRAVVSVDGEVKRDAPKPTRGQSILSSDDDNLKAALRYIAATTGGDWNQLYRAFDAVGKVEGLRAGGVPRQDAVRLAQTFSLHRKHQSLPLDGEPMPFHEARSLILQAVRNR